MSPQKVSYYLYQYDQYEYRSLQEEVPYGNWKDQKLFQWKCELNNFVEWNSVNQTLRGRVLSIKTELQDEICAWRKLMKRLLPLLVIHPPCWFMSEVHFAASMSNVRKVLGCLVTAGLNPALNGYHAVSGHVESLSRGVNENLTLHRIRICSFYFLKDHLTTFTFIQLTDWYYDISRDCVKTILSRLRVKTIFGPTIICSCHVPDLYLRPTSTLFVFCKTSLSLDLPLIMIVASPNQLN